MALGFHIDASGTSNCSLASSYLEISKVHDEARLLQSWWLLDMVSTAQVTLLSLAVGQDGVISVGRHTRSLSPSPPPPSPLSKKQTRRPTCTHISKATHKIDRIGNQPQDLERILNATSWVSRLMLRSAKPDARTPDAQKA